LTFSCRFYNNETYSLVFVFPECLFRFSHFVLSYGVTCDIFLNLFPSLSQACYLMFPCSFVSFGILPSFLKVSMLCSFFMYSVIFCGTYLCIVALDFFRLFWLSKLFLPYIFWSLWLPFKMSDWNTAVESICSILNGKNILLRESKYCKIDIFSSTFKIVTNNMICICIYDTLWFLHFSY
jgi:hypothetical protein